MANLFDSANYPTSEPAELVIGDRWAWKRTDLGSDYPPASYALSYSLRAHESGAEIEITANESGSEYHVEVASATTAGYTAGDYHWQAYITRSSDSERVVIDRGTVTVKPNLDAADADPRSHVKKVLDAIEAVLENRATADQESYAIAGRSLSRTPIADLLTLRDRYRAEWHREQAAERIKRGLGHAGRVLVRF